MGIMSEVEENVEQLVRLRLASARSSAVIVI
jgi:hypothetical protein